MFSYFAIQDVPEDFANEPRLVANIIAGRVEYLLNRVTSDGLNPIDGTLSVEPGDDLVIGFYWTPLNDKESNV